MKIRIDEERVKTACAALRFTNKELETNMKEIERVVYSLGRDWKGEAEEAYEQKLLAACAEYRKILEFFRKYTVEIESMGNVYEEWERKNAVRIREL